MSNITPRIPSEVQPLAGGDILHRPVNDMGDDEVAEAWAACDFVEERVKARKEVLRARLLESAKVKGVPAGGGQRYDIPGVATVTRERRESKLPEELGLKTLLHAKGVELDKALTAKVVMEIDPSKLAALVATGVLKAEDLVPLRKVTWALKFYGSEELNETLKAAEERYIAEAVAHGAPPVLPVPAARKPHAKKATAEDK